MEDAAYLGGMSDTIGEGRRRLLDLLRRGEVEQAERLLDAMEEMYGVLVTMDYPDAITMNLRRATDVSRSLIEKTRGDLVDLGGPEGSRATRSIDTPPSCGATPPPAAEIALLRCPIPGV